MLDNEPLINSVANRNFTLTYKQHYLFQTYFRYGIGFSFNKLKNGSDDQKFLSTNFRIGFETKFRFDKRWSINRGSDIVVTLFRGDNNFFEEKTKITRIGFVPFFGIQYNINPRINLTTESGIGFFYINEKNSQLFTGFSINPVDRKGTQINIFAPQELILSIAF